MEEYRLEEAVRQATAALEEERQAAALEEERRRQEEDERLDSLLRSTVEVLAWEAKSEEEQAISDTPLFSEVSPVSDEHWANMLQVLDNGIGMVSAQMAEDVTPDASALSELPRTSYLASAPMPAHERSPRSPRSPRDTSGVDRTWGAGAGYRPGANMLAGVDSPRAGGFSYVGAAAIDGFPHEQDPLNWRRVILQEPQTTSNGCDALLMDSLSKISAAEEAVDPNMRALDVEAGRLLLRTAFTPFS